MVNFFFILIVNVLQKMCHRIVFNIMSICSREEKTQLMLNIKGPALSMFNKLYEQYQYSFGTI